MLACDLPCNPSLDNPYPLDLSTMSEEASTPIHDADSSPEHEHQSQNVASNPHNDTATSATTTTPIPSRSQRPSRACTARAAGRFYAPPVIERKPKPAKKDRLNDSPPQQCGSNSRIVTPLVNSPPPSQLPRWSLRSMWELASILNFLHVFRPLLNINVEFSAEEFETALITPNDTLGDIHIPLLKAIPPVTRMALGRGTWVTVLCRKLRDWWHWVADGELPIVASHGAEIEVYNTLEPGVRVVILKALCDIRVEQEDIRNYIDNSIKHGVQLSAFRKERVGGDSQGISYWYEDDPVIGHRLYREIRKIEVKKVKARGVHSLPSATYQWETVATNLDEFQDVSEKLFSSKNRTEASLGKKLKNDMLPEIEKVHKRKEKLLKKQHREALLLDNFLGVDGLGTAGRSLRDRKPVTYTFDDYDRSINEAIKITKRKQPSPEPTVRREFVPKPEAVTKPEASTNGRWSGPSPSQPSQDLSFNAPSPNSPDDNFIDEEDHTLEPLDRGNRRRQRPQRYSEKEFVEDVSDNEAGFDSDDDIVGEAVYDEEYLKKRKQKKASSSSEGEGDEEYRGDEENAEDEEEEEEEDESLSMSEDSDNPRRRRFKKLSGRTRRETKLRSVDEIQSGLRRSRRATRTRINYRQIEFSESDSEPNIEPEKSNASSDDVEYQQDSDGNDDDVEMKVVDKPPPPPEKLNSSGENEVEIGRERRFLDLNELAPGSGFEDGPNMVMKDDRDDL